MLCLAVLTVLGENQRREWQLKGFHHTKRIGEKFCGAGHPTQPQGATSGSNNSKLLKKSETLAVQGRLMKNYSSS